MREPFSAESLLYGTQFRFNRRAQVVQEGVAPELNLNCVPYKDSALKQPESTRQTAEVEILTKR